MSSTPTVERSLLENKFRTKSRAWPKKNTRAHLQVLYTCLYVHLGTCMETLNTASVSLEAAVLQQHKFCPPGLVNPGK